MNEKDLGDFLAKFTPSDVDKLKSDIKTARHSYIITDPYPTEKDKDISIYKAYNDGINFLWKLIEPLVK